LILVRGRAREGEEERERERGREGEGEGEGEDGRERGRMGGNKTLFGHVQAVEVVDLRPTQISVAHY
jgi:hypothetical protein